MTKITPATITSSHMVENIEPTSIDSTERLNPLLVEMMINPMAIEKELTNPIAVSPSTLLCRTKSLIKMAATMANGMAINMGWFENKNPSAIPVNEICANPSPMSAWLLATKKLESIAVVLASNKPIRIALIIKGQVNISNMMMCPFV